MPPPFLSPRAHIRRYILSRHTLRYRRRSHDASFTPRLRHSPLERRRHLAAPTPFIQAFAERPRRAAHLPRFMLFDYGRHHFLPRYISRFCRFIREPVATPRRYIFRATPEHAADTADASRMRRRCLLHVAAPAAECRTKPVISFAWRRRARYRREIFSTADASTSMHSRRSIMPMPDTTPRHAGHAAALPPNIYAIRRILPLAIALRTPHIAVTTTHITARRHATSLLPAWLRYHATTPRYHTPRRFDR